MPDDETVNQMIARHEEEFDLFMVSAAQGPEGCSAASRAPPCQHQIGHITPATVVSAAGDRAGGVSRGGSTLPPE